MKEEVETGVNQFAQSIQQNQEILSTLEDSIKQDNLRIARSVAIMLKHNPSQQSPLLKLQK